MLAGTTAKFLEESVPVAELRARRDDPVGFDAGYWRQGAELGWTSLLVSEDDGGGSISGRGLSDLSLLAFEFGRNAAPGPLVTNNVVASAVSRLGSAAQKAEVLGGLLDGSQLAAWCAAERFPHDGFGVVTAELVPSGDGYVLNGRKVPVESGDQADWLLVVAKSPGGLSEVLLPASTPGVSVSPMGSVDLTRHFSTITFSDVAVSSDQLLGGLDQAAAEVERSNQEAIVIELSEMIGSMDKAFEMTVEWSFNRYSFGRPLASYQALKHRFADMKIWLEASNGICDDAIAALEDGNEDAARLVSAAKAYVSWYGPELAQDCVQLHGGIGVTFEHDLHLYLRRIVLGSQLYGTVADHRAQLTTILENKEATS